MLMKPSLVLTWLLFLLLPTCNAFSPRVQRVVGEYGVHIGAAVEWSDWNYSTRDIPTTFGFSPRAYVGKASYVVGG